MDSLFFDVHKIADEMDGDAEKVAIISLDCILTDLHQRRPFNHLFEEFWQENSDAYHEMIACWKDDIATAARGVYTPLEDSQPRSDIQGMQRKAWREEDADKIRLGFYRHWKGGLYNVVGVATHTEVMDMPLADANKLVTYTNKRGELFCRPSHGENGWLTPIENREMEDGAMYSGRRFTKL